MGTENPIETEVWKDIKGYEGFYQVSNIGRVKSLERIIIMKGGKRLPLKERILKLGTHRDGYLQIRLSKNGKRRIFYVHRLVCEAFHENPENKPCVNHIDEDKTNNTASNLEWCTVTENNNHGTSEVQRQLGFDQGHISAVALGKLKTAYGYVWKYIDEEM